jgi:uncharacterized protein (DUF1778 family)
MRLTAFQKAKLAEAARIRNMNVSQFVLSESLDAAEQVIADERLIRVDREEYEWLLSKLDEPTRSVAELKRLFDEPSVFER